MSNRSRFVSSSVGTKILLALTGLSLFGFLVVHLIGNLLALAGPETFNGYSHKLISNPLVYVAEAGLAALFGLHVFKAATNWWANRTARPQNLFSHDDQQEQNQSAIPNNQTSVGWGGRIGDRVQVMNAGSTVPMNISVGGNDIFLKGQAVAAYSVPAGGNFGLAITGGNAAQQQARRTALQSLFTLDRQNQQVRAAADSISSAINASGTLNTVINNAASLAAPAFQGLNTGLSRQLFAVAKMVEGRATLGLRRQIFFAQAGGFDNHQNQLADQGNRFNEVGPALRAFYNALTALGMQDQVTLFTLSDFGRTLRVNDGGSDHAWGNHHIVMGGAVRGGQTYGAFPNQALGGPDDTDRDGRWIPTTAVDQYAATLAKWFGVPDADIPAVVPNIARFATRDLGFMA